MELSLQREILTEVSTISGIYLDGERLCYNLEDKDRGLHQDMSLKEIEAIKVKGKTAIPYGEYQILITQSARFTREKGRPFFTPQLMNVPGFSGIRIHPGNTAEDTEGCLLPGESYGKDRVNNSRIAYEKLLAKINSAIKAGDQVYIKIETKAQTHAT